MNSLGKKHEDLNECGEIAKAFLNAVGPALQDDFEMTGGLNPGQVSVSSAPLKLDCKVLLHLGVERWVAGKSKAVIVTLIISQTFTEDLINLKQKYLHTKIPNCIDSLQIKITTK